ncbi:hypothetical protein EVG20_g2161 [Dentipellis fragilis]|uniref:Uncharacterized protein n=1 Tax=Dentipellis fragilis TaxID=205917 RepID=A0A4Y9ZAK2_9AGAM|nr:hypothetical protein EVG20_g2161 [Dentipellis fragilis]
MVKHLLPLRLPNPTIILAPHVHDLESPCVAEDTRYLPMAKQPHPQPIPWSVTSTRASRPGTPRLMRVGLSVELEGCQVRTYARIDPGSVPLNLTSQHPCRAAEATICGSQVPQSYRATSSGLEPCQAKRGTLTDVRAPAFQGPFRQARVLLCEDRKASKNRHVAAPVGSHPRRPHQRHAKRAHLPPGAKSPPLGPTSICHCHCALLTTGTGTLHIRSTIQSIAIATPSRAYPYPCSIVRSDALEPRRAVGSTGSIGYRASALPDSNIPTSRDAAVGIMRSDNGKDLRIYHLCTSTLVPVSSIPSATAATIMVSHISPARTPLSSPRPATQSTSTAEHQKLPDHDQHRDAHVIGLRMALGSILSPVRPLHCAASHSIPEALPSARPSSTGSETLAYIQAPATLRAESAGPFREDARRGTF